VYLSPINEFAPRLDRNAEGGNGIEHSSGAFCIPLARAMSTGCAAFSETWTR
jgi:hypothetical protein